jgi:hypothetical protein
MIQPGIALHATWIQAACGRAVQCYWQEMAAFVHYMNACASPIAELPNIGLVGPDLLLFGDPVAASERDVKLCVKFITLLVDGGLD